jgi:RNA polymerase-binding transcription factor DksA
MEEAVIRDALDAERQTARRRIGELTAEFDEIVAATADANTDDEHDPEGSTIAYDRALVIALLGEAESSLAEVERALDRLRSGQYGRCAVCGAEIAQDRLQARPTASTCIACASGIGDRSRSDRPMGLGPGGPG